MNGRKETTWHSGGINDFFQKRKRRNVVRLRWEKAQVLYEEIFPPKKKPPKYYPVQVGNVGKYVNELIANHQQYARHEDEYTRLKIQQAVQNVNNRMWAREKQIQLKKDFAWAREKQIQLEKEFAWAQLSVLKKIEWMVRNAILDNLLGRMWDSTPRLVMPIEYFKAKEVYLGWMDRIMAWVDFDEWTKVLSDDFEDNSPHPRNKTFNQNN